MHMKRLAFFSFLIITGCSSTPPIPEEQDFLLQSDQIAQIEKKDQTMTLPMVLVLLALKAKIILLVLTLNGLLLTACS